MANVDDHHHPKDYCIWNPGSRPKKVSPIANVFNELRSLNLERKKKGILEGCIRGFEDHQQPELGTGSSSPRFLWSKAFKQWKNSSIKHLPCLSNITMSETKDITQDPDLCHLYNFKSSLINFSLSDLKSATNNFSKRNIIGRGGFSEVYKGRLRDGQLIAVKRMKKGTPDERTSNFLSELGIIAHIDHPNTAKLVGCCVEGEMHLVFQLSLLGSLDSLLQGSNRYELDWSKRYKIVVGIADGLLYLHQNCQKRIIHRDIKAGNILLTENFEPQICDFGLAKWLPEQCTHHNVSKFQGTFGYFAPEYLLRGIVNEKTDVYSFGVLLLEIITGRRALDPVYESVVSWAKPLLDANNIKDLIDPTLGDDYDQGQMYRVVLTASLCVEKFPSLRPCMSQVAVLLRSDDFVVDSAKECPRRSPVRTYREELKMRRRNITRPSN